MMLLTMMSARMMMAGWAPKRRSCALCGRSEATAALYLAPIMVDGAKRRACDSCRASARVFFCQGGCREQQGGQRLHRSGLVVCVLCAARIDAQVEDAP